MITAIPTISISSNDLYNPDVYPNEGFYIAKTETGSEELIFCFERSIHIIATLNFHNKDIIINKLLESLPNDSELLFENQLLREKIKLLQNEIARLNNIIDKMNNTIDSNTVIRILDKFKQLIDDFKNK